MEEVTIRGEGVDRRVTGLRVGGEAHAFDQVISTIPLPYLVRVMPGLPEEEKAKVAAIRNVGVVCVLLKLRRPFTLNFWMNINDPRIEIPGLIEYTNLNPLDGSAIAYAPFYMQTHPKYRRDFKLFIEETLGYMRLVRPDFDPASEVVRARHRATSLRRRCARPASTTPCRRCRSRVSGLFMADTSHYYRRTARSRRACALAHACRALALEQKVAA